MARKIMQQTFDTAIQQMVLISRRANFLFAFSSSFASMEAVNGALGGEENH